MKRIALVFVFLTIFSYQVSVFSQDDKNRKMSVAMEEQVTPEMNIIDNKLYLKNAPVGKRVEVISIIGNKVLDIKITNSVLEGYELNLRRGIYIFKMDGIVKKAVIK